MLRRCDMTFAIFQISTNVRNMDSAVNFVPTQRGATSVLVSQGMPWSLIKRHAKLQVTLN